jgi:hypothetical protein
VRHVGVVNASLLRCGAPHVPCSLFRANRSLFLSFSLAQNPRCRVQSTPT